LKGILNISISHKKEMETVVETLHMNKGAGETSYAMNSLAQVYKYRLAFKCIK
jgi:hypothetical protein